MSQIKNGVFIIESTPDEICEECGKSAELRPYGEGGKKICHCCAEKDWDNVQIRMEEAMSKADDIVIRSPTGKIHDLGNVIPTKGGLIFLEKL